MKTRAEVVRDINELVLHTVRSNPNEHGEISVVLPCPLGMHIFPQDITSVRLSDFRDRVLTSSETDVVAEWLKQESGGNIEVHCISGVVSADDAIPV